MTTKTYTKKAACAYCHRGVRLLPSRRALIAISPRAYFSTPLKHLLTALLILLLPATAWGQDPYEGTWYITNGNNYYLCPAAGYYNGNVETPYITTYQTGKDKNSIWRIEKAEVSGDIYYRFIHNLTGKYLTANDAVSGFDAGYLRLHLESFDTPTDATLFIIVTHKGKIGIRSKNYNDAANDHYWFDISQGNKGNLWQDNGQGQLGFWYNITTDDGGNTIPADDKGAPWTFQTATPVCATPVITYNEAESTFSISYIGDDTGVTIHYTTDGTEPTASSTTYSGAISAASVTTKLRAIAVKTDYNNSEEAVVYGTAYSATPHLFKTSDYQTVDGVNSYYNFSYYLISPVDDSDANEGRNYLTTSNVPNARMQWLIKPATACNGVQYHYLVNAETGKYIYFTGTNINQGNKFVVKARDEAGLEDDRFMFRIWEGTTDGIDYFNFSPKLISGYPPSHKKDNFLCKQNNANNNNPTGVYREDNTNGRARWQMIDVPAEAKSLSELPTAMVSDASNRVYFKLRSAVRDDGGNDYFVYPPSDKAYATAATSGSNPEWYLVEAADADTWNTYYNIRNAQTGNYLYFDSETRYNNNDNKFLTSSGITSGSEDKYKFLVLKTANTTYSGTYHIVPKAIRDNNNQANIALSRENKTSAKLRSSNSRDNDKACWYLDAVDFKCTVPTFQYVAGEMSIKCPTEGAVIYYSLGSSEPAITDANRYSGPFTLPEGTTAVTAIAVRNADASDKSDAATFTIQIVSSGDDITNMSGFYTLAANFTPSSTPIGTKDEPFRGIIDGQLYPISGLSHPFFGYVENAVIRNIILDNVGISSGISSDDEDNGNTGAIACVAKGSTRIYNCGVLATNSTVETDDDGYTKITSCRSTVSGSNYVGGIVGLLDGEARVINCFSYADITGGTNVGGIVGYNNVATTAANLKTMVMNCMFYGDITGGTNKAPIYNGSNIVNKDANGVSNFNYFWGGASYVENREIDTYNCALMAETRYLQRFEFFRHLLNSNRELAAWWATDDLANKDQMMKWVLEPSQIGSSTPYPILKAPGYYSSVVNIDAEHATTQTERNKGGLLGTLTVNIESGDGAQFDAPVGVTITTPSLTLNITDKDPEHFNFNYGKVQLPYYNDVGTGNYTGNRVVTGWKITSITTDGTVSSYNSFSTGEDATVDADGKITAAPYNFADRHCTEKDLYSKSGRVFNQGAYWDVPEGVTSITIEPYWAQAVYCADNYRDVVYNTGMSGKNYIGNTLFNNGDSRLINGSSQKVYSQISSAVGALTINGGVYDNAIVLVGNVHQNSLSSDDKSKPYTIMSIDLDKDNEPDYSYILRFDGRSECHPVRVDFLNIPGLGMAQKSTGGTGTYNFGILIPKGWFESTNTSLFRFTQFEYEHSSRTADDALILQGGVMEQWVSFSQKGVSHKTPYIHVGGNVWFKEFHLGTHQDRTQNTRHTPISVTGGDFDEFYLTGLYRGDFTAYDDNAECYINGGRFGIVAGTGMEGLGTSSGKGNIVWQIQNSDIKEFYGGGINATKPAIGNITNVIEGGYIKQFCGGPKFGDMSTGKKVITTATGCKFDNYFGAGYGGNSYSRFTPSNINNINGDYTGWNTFLNNNYKQNYESKYGGVSVTYFTQYIPMSNNTQNVARLLIDYVSFSLATTHDVTSKLTGCEITGNFYGGGSLGKVDGPVTSTLDGCTVQGSVFGAGYSASKPTVDVINTGNFATAPYYDSNLGVYFDPVFPATVTYRWEHSDTKVSSDATAIDKENYILYTNENLNDLGTVSGNVTLNITGNTKVEGKIFDENGDVTAQTGGVFGGGAKSEVTGSDKSVTVNINQTGGSATYYINNVYGGGDEGDVASEVVVNIQSESSYVLHDVFGGGNAADVKKNTQVNMTLGTVMGNIYGGGNLGDVGTIDKSNLRAYAWTGTDGNANSTDAYADTNTGVTHVTITGGTPSGNVFGGGKGLANTFWCEKGMVYSTDVKVKDATVGGSVYGGGELGRVETDTKVTIGPEADDDKTIINGNVFGAGQGVATHGYSALVRGNTLVTIQHGAKVSQNVYGGGKIASVGKYNVDSNGMPYSLANNGSGICRVNIPGATKITGDIFGGGKGVVPDFQNSGDNRSKRMVNYSATSHLEAGKGTAWDYYDADDHTYVWEYFADEAAYLIYLQTLALATETEVIINPGATDSPVQSTKGNVYGGSENGIVQHDTKVTISGNCLIGEGEGNGNIYGGGKGLEGNDGAGQVNGDAKVSINSGEIRGSVFGGGVLGATKGNVIVNINGGTIINDVYGGGAYANTNTSNWHKYVAVTEVPANPKSEGLYERSFGGAYSLTTDTEPVANKTYYTENATATWTDSEKKSALNTTHVHLRGGTISGAAYGGALGDGSHSPKVYGDILVELNKETCTNGTTVTTKTPTEAGCIVNQVFGCNNAYGSPQGDVKVYVYGTQNTAASHIANQEGDSGETIPKKKGRYDVAAVYGGGNQAAYDPVDDAANKTQVIIEGCDLTSIQTVYGGGNAAPVPSTDVTVNSCYEIETLFGGGNGSGSGNPGADVGIIDQSAYAADNTTGTYGPGTALAKLSGGEIHTVYGGSNTKGNIVGGASVQVNEGGTCTLKVGQIYGAGNDAEMDGGTDIVMGCMPDGVIEEIYAGARNADVAGDVKLTITSGTFGRVFGGNKHGGKLKGSITVNVEETGDCDQPLIIGELYGGGNLADYSIYGYKNTGTEESPVWEARESASDAGTGPATPYSDPKLNVRAFTSIGAVYGGGYRAKMVANPTVDINVVKGSHAATARDAGTITGITLQKKENGAIVEDGTTTLSYPAHEAGKIGTIGNVFGGGNLAEIKGNATVNIGTETKIYFKTEPTQFRVDAGTPLKPVAKGTNAGLYEATVEGAIIKGTVYGGGNEADITGNTQVNICAKYDSDASEYRRVAPGTAGVTIDHDVFGAGKGKDDDATSAFVSGKATVVMADGTVKQSVYGGGELSQVGGDTDVRILGGSIGTSGQGGATWGNVYGGGQGNTTDIMTGLIKGNTIVKVSGGEILHNIYGGGAHGSVGTFTYADDAYHTEHSDVAVGTILGLATSGTGNASITITGGTIGTTGQENGMVFGSSRGDIDAPDAIYDRLAWVYSTNVTIGTENDATDGPAVKGSIYGSGENGHTYQDAYVTIHSGTVGIASGVEVTSQGQTYTGAAYPYRGNVYGGGCGTDMYYSTGTETHDGNGDTYNPIAGIVKGDTRVTINGGQVVRHVYGGGAMGSVTGSTTVTISGGIIGVDGNDNGNVYAASRGNLTDQDKATVGGTTLTVSGGEVKGSVFGGGAEGRVKGSVAVNVTGGVVKNDVYGGGALADTNTDNVANYGTNSAAISSTSTNTTTVSLSGGVIGNAYGGGLGQLGTGVHYTTEECDAHNNSTNITGWIASGTVLTAEQATLVNNALGLTGDAAYNAEVSGKNTISADHAAAYNATLAGYITTADWKVHPSEGTGNVKAIVYGDVTVTVNGLDETTHEYGTARFTIASEEHTYQKKVRNALNVEETVTEKGTVYTKGRVFGCNNINGTPKGNVTVEVWKTMPQEGTQHIYTEDGGSFEVQGVYGGGNLSNYNPVDGKQTTVDIHGCGETSIQYVFGGGNAASVPETHVNIYGTFEIEAVFGGGNGNEPIYSEGTWIQSPGAEIMGNTNVRLMAGLMHQAFGGSFEKGIIHGTTNIEKSGEGGEGCTLKITDIFGGGKDADVQEVNIVLSECDMSGIEGVNAGDATQQIENVYAGSYNARILGDVTMTIKSGIFKNVFGGNYNGGFINGSITLNVEETSNCKPIKITNLYGGGNYAPYPGAGANNPDPKITINVKACTHIGNVYGGSYHADVTGNTEVNINMIKGWWAGKTYTPSGENPESEDIPDAIGTIGNVYGGGDQGRIIGNTVVNIGTLTEITLVTTPEKDAGGNVPAHLIAKADGKYDVLGAHITGNVYGGGNQAEVTGNSIVNICATANASTHLYAAKVAEGASGVTIDGTGYTYGVFGGGNKGNVNQNSYVNMGGGKVNQSVYGGGCEADVLGNTFVTMSDGYVFDGVAGGGLSGSVGTFNTSTSVTDFGHVADHDGCIGKPTTLKTADTGKCKVVISGGQVGPVTLATEGMTRSAANGGPVAEGWVWGAGRGLVEDPATHPDTHFKTYVYDTYVTIEGEAFIVGSVIGGGEFGRVLHDTHVTIQGNCQIGVGEGQTEDGGLKPKRYTTAQWTAAASAVQSGTASDINAAVLAECSHFPYGRVVGTKKVYETYDPYYDKYYSTTEAPDDYANASTAQASDGKTWIGCVFGGGSGYYPYEKDYEKTGERGYDWVRSAGWVEGDANVTITGGHILTNVYGGNEYTDVKGKCTVKMSGGTIGVPRTLKQIAEHPVTCYLFGGGKGDQRSHFNDMTNVGSATVEVSGGIIFGSIFGGSEDGHVLGNTSVKVSKGDAFTVGETEITTGPIIGTWGTSYVDGNVFGGGRGFSGEELTAGSVGGNVKVNIQGGKMLGSVYGGGRLASVGISHVSPTLADGTPNPAYGLLRDEKGKEGDPTYGHVTVDISGGTIGGGIAGSNTDLEAGYYDTKHSGNVFGGCMGRITLLDGTTNSLWPKLAVSKLTDVTIGTKGSATGPTIYRNVYGGGEYGVVRNQATVTVNSGTVCGSVFGSGHGSDDNVTKNTITAGGYDDIPTVYYTFTPMSWAGCVSGNTQVYIKGGWVKKNVYGGGELASVGLINYNSNEAGTVYNYITKHDDVTTGFALSWPYEVEYIASAPNDAATVGGGKDAIGGKATVNITGGRIGITGKDVMVTGGAREDNGDVYGGSMGKAGDRYDMAFCANVKETAVTINYTSSTAEPGNYTTDVSASDKGDNDCIAGSVYGGGENGHVIGNTSVTLTKGLIGHAIYGGGKGKDKYHPNDLKKYDGTADDSGKAYSITAGKVYGNTKVEMKGGYVVRNVYGGGNMASVGKGNYAGGSDDYSAGYGEKITGALWDNTDFTGSGMSKVEITGGQVGYINSSAPDKTLKDGLPYGNVYGGCRGQAAAEVSALDKNPSFYVGFVNETDVTIGDVTIGNGSGGPTIYGSVYGGGQDGHVRRDTKVTIYNGTIGIDYSTASAAMKAYALSNAQWLHRGNVYGGGSGLGLYEYDYDGDGVTFTDADNDGDYDEGEVRDSYTDQGVTVYDVSYSNSSGSVTRNTTVEVKGGTIHRNVYGGGSLASVFPPGWVRGTETGDAAKGKPSVTTLTISDGTVGSSADYANDYGGNVFGAGRGMNHTEVNLDYFALTTGTEVNITGGTMYGNVYGGGEMGKVYQDTEVNLTGGSIAHDAYGGGRGTESIAADVGGNTSVELNKGLEGTDKGCSLERIFGCNDLNGTPKGHASVHVYATQHKNKEAIHDDTKDNDDYKKYPKYGNVTQYTAASHSELATLAAAVGMSASDISGYEAAITSAEGDDAKKTALDNWREDVSLLKYDVEAVYGGGNLAPYEPTAPSELASVVIDGCELTSIKQVYGGGNAASTPANSVTVNGTYEIDEVFGGGNGKDPYQKDNGSGVMKWYQNPGANVGYKDFTHTTTGSGDTKDDPILQEDNDNAKTKEGRQDAANGYIYGSGVATTTILGGRIHYVYGGSNQRGNIREEALSVYQESGYCDLNVDETTAAGKNADTDAKTTLNMECVQNVNRIFGGSTNADVYNDVTLNITNGTFEQVFGGNNTNGAIYGSITVNIEEGGCQPIEINELYAGGYLAPYSIYGYETNADGSYKTDDNGKIVPKRTGANPKNHPRINIISASRIGDVYGGGYQAEVVGDPYINVNMKQGYVLVRRKEKNNDYDYEYEEAGTGDFEGKTFVYVDGKYVDGTTEGTGHSYDIKDLIQIPGAGNENRFMYPLALGYIGNIYGGGNQANITGNTHVEIGTGQWITSWNDDGTPVYSATGTYVTGRDGVGAPTYSTDYRKAAVIIGSVYGGGKMGHVGYYTNDANGKPTECTIGGNTHVTISNGSIGPDNMQMTKAGGPDDAGHVFGGGQGTVDILYDQDITDAEKQTTIAGLTAAEIEAKEAAINLLAYANNTEVTINGDAFVKGSVYGGSENGHVLGDTHVVIDGDCQIGNGDGVNRPYTSEEWAYDVTADPTKYLPECASWAYTSPYKVHDKFANAEGDLDKYSDGTASVGRRTASDGHTFYGNVFGGGSGYYPYAPGKWAKKAGWVEGNTTVEIKGGHILTNVYGGNEMTNVGDGLTAGKGKSTVKMSGGTLGVPRTLAQIAAHPVTCYLFGAGKGDQNVHFNKDTNVKEVEVEITGGKIYGSVFGGGEDGHVLGDVKMTIGSDDGTGPTIGTWGTSYVDGNVFGGGRGFSGEAFTAGNVGGSVDLQIKGGTMLGSVYGGGRLGSVGYGLYDVSDVANYGKMRDDDKDDAGNATDYYTPTTGTGLNKMGRGHVNIDISGGTIGNNLEYKYYTFSAESEDAARTLLNAQKDIDHIPDEEFVLHNVVQEGGDTKKYIFRQFHTQGGNVHGGGMGRFYGLDGKTVIPRWFNLGAVKSTKITISGGIIKSSVYGGCELGQVTGSYRDASLFEKTVTIVDGKEKVEAEKPIPTRTSETLTDILITGGSIGSDIKDNSDVTRLVFGAVYGGGYGNATEKLNYTTVGTQKYESNPKFSSGIVEGNTKVDIRGGKVHSSVYGGGKVGNVHGNASVSISGATEIGRDKDVTNNIYFGGQFMGNVYGGGAGTRTVVRCGQIFGNTSVSISNSTADAAYHEAHPDVEEGTVLSPRIYHNVYGGGAFGTVGRFKYKTEYDEEHNTTKVFGVESLDPTYGNGTGTATINITGGTIGVDGHENGMVFGSSRGEVIDNYPRDDYMAWVNDAVVNIGTAGQGIAAPQPQIKGSVYGSGENGHTLNQATVNIHSGTIGDASEYYAYRGNVYGAGCGTDYYMHEGKKYYKPWAGIVRGNTEVNIDGGFIAGNVYGAGAMASVGTIANAADTASVAKAKHASETNGFALSWPYEFEFASGTGTATINIIGGHIGINDSDGGDVYGSARGEAGDRYAMAHHAYAKETVVNISYPTTASLEDLGDTSKGCIVGSVHGSGENGYVYGDTHVTLNKGLVGHALYGGGKGYGTYEVTLNKIVGTGTYTSNIYSLIAGKVMGNTYVTMNDGFVGRNIYGGGNIASVGKGNYAGGVDDYFPAGYGETLTGNLWTTSATEEDPDNAWHFLNSGKTTVNVIGGTVGIVNTALKEGLPYGNVFGSSRGEAAPNVPVSLTPRYQYCPGFYSGYVNETDVTIGGYSCKTQYTSGDITYSVGDKLTAEQYGALASADKANWELTGPTIRGSVYGGGQDGHVRRDTKVTMYSGEIGLPYTSANQTLLQTSDLDNALWLHRGNIYGGGSGIDKYQFDFNNNGTIGGSSVIGTSTYNEEDYSTSAGSVTRFTEVNVLGGTIHRNVYGGGSMGSVGAPKITQDYYPYKKGDTAVGHGEGKQSQCTVNIGGGTSTVTIGTPDGYNEVYGGEVYGACRGLKELDPVSFATTVWTLVNIKDKVTIMGNVFGGGDAGSVLRDSKVVVGEE